MFAVTADLIQAAREPVPYVKVPVTVTDHSLLPELEWYVVVLLPVRVAEKGAADPEV